MRFTPWFIWTVLILGGYLCGGILFSLHIPKLLRGIDICQVSDDHNPGAANVFTHAGWEIGIICLLLDLLKGFLPVYAAVKTVDTNSFLFSLVMVAPVLGHATAPFYKQSGGKCIATSFGVLTALFPLTWIMLILAGFYILFSTLIKIRPNRIRSIVTYALFAIAAIIVTIFNHMYAIGLGCVFVSGVAIVKHSNKPERLSQQMPDQVLLNK